MTQPIKFIPSWRWFGPTDPITLPMIAKTPARSVVTALHHLPNGAIWPEAEIGIRKKEITRHGLEWRVVESLPVHEAIKYGGKNRKALINNYQQSLINLAKQGIDTVCYNFMPVIDWVRTDLAFPWKNGTFSMLFDYPTFAAFDCFILKRPGAEQDYEAMMLDQARQKLEAMTDADCEALAYNIIVVTQGFIDGGVGDTKKYKTAFLEKMKPYAGMNDKDLLYTLCEFLNEVAPVAEEHGIQLAIHPDDPPFPVLGLPRIAGTIEQFEQIIGGCSSGANGITFCAGSLSARADNHLPEFVQKLASRIYFAHLRNTTLLGTNGSFCESGHLEGGVDMKNIIRLLHVAMQQRLAKGQKNHQISMRPDHGLNLPEDVNMGANPGYPYHGRKKGLEQILDLEQQVMAENQ